MRSTFEPLGKYVRLVDERNTDMVTESVLGINIDKYFMPSVANVIGTDLSTYKLLRKGRFACNPMHVGRDGRLPVVRYEKDTPAIVSPAYFMFEVIDEREIEPEYLMLCFRRPDFDRMCWFRTDASVRGGITWEDVCALTIPVPTIGEQRKIVHDYRVIRNRIELLQGIIKKTNAQMRAYVKDWVKEHAEEEGKLHDYCRMEYGFTETAQSDAVGPKFLRITDITGTYIDWDTVPYCPISDADLKKYKLRKGDVVIARTGATSGAAKMIGGDAPDAVFASFLVRAVAIESEWQLFLGLAITDDDFYKYVQANAEVAGSAQPQANPPLLGQYIISVPSKDDLPAFNDTINVFLNYMDKCASEISKLNSLQTLILSGFATSKGA